MAVIGGFDRLNFLSELGTPVDVGSGSVSTAVQQATVLKNLGLLPAATAIVLGTPGNSAVVTTDGSGNITINGTLTALGGDAASGPLTVTSASASAFAVGLTGATNSAFKVDASTASQ